MQTHLADFIRESENGRTAEQILRKCVHCGFCNATCPTYQILGDELDGPRGRIYLIKQVLEGVTPGSHTQLHLDRCLTCRSCETTCPSGVKYSQLLDIGRELVEPQVKRPVFDRLLRKGLCAVIPNTQRVRLLYAIAGLIKPLLPGYLKRKVPEREKRIPRPESAYPDRVLMLSPCVQSVVAPQIDDAAACMLDVAGMSAIQLSGGGCCGAVHAHLGDRDGAKDIARANIDAWWPHLQSGAKSIVATSSGCGVMLREYADLLKGDPGYAAKAARAASRVQDLSELVSVCENPGQPASTWRKVSFHSPCTLQHGLRVNGRIENLIQDAGFELCSVADSHLCCGSAGTYSILQPELANTLRANKLRALQAGDPDVIVTANIGCLLHLQEQTERPVRHWTELFLEYDG